MCTTGVQAITMATENTAGETSPFNSYEHPSKKRLSIKYKQTLKGVSESTNSSIVETDTINSNTEDDERCSSVATSSSSLPSPEIFRKGDSGACVNFENPSPNKRYSILVLYVVRHYVFCPNLSSQRTVGSQIFKLIHWILPLQEKTLPWWRQRTPRTSACIIHQTFQPSLVHVEMTASLTKKKLLKYFILPAILEKEL